MRGVSRGWESVKGMREGVNGDERGVNGDERGCQWGWESVNGYE